MLLLTTFVAIVQSFSISLGVGSSTLAIVNFFVAISDGKIDETERRMMGIVYVVLRIAMILILATTVLLMIFDHLDAGIDMTSLVSAQLVVLIVLFLNATLMTMRKMPSTFGPALQAGSWYTLGTLAALVPLGLTTFTLTEFFLGYVTWLILAIAIVNGVMAILKHKKHKQQAQTPAQ
jgi:hypothetical protein